MANENAFLEEAVLLGEEYVDFDELEATLNDQLNEELSELSFLEEEKEQIGNPDNFGSVIKDEIWKQFGNQIGLDITNETLIQKYDREHPEAYDAVGPGLKSRFNTFIEFDDYNVEELEMILDCMCKKK